MSARFAVPATTFVLRSIIEKRLKSAYGTFTPPAVSVTPPPRPPAPTNGALPPEAPGLNLYLHHAGANPAWRNMYDPHVAPGGERTGPSPLVLDLHYMLSAYGQDLEREALLGIAMNALHRNGVVPRPMIAAILGAVSVPVPPNKFMDELTKEPLDKPGSQPESITISQAPVDIDQSTKIWSALHAPLRPCAYYLVTTVFLDVEETFPAAKDVDEVVIAARPAVTPSPRLPTDDVIKIEDGP